MKRCPKCQITANWSSADCPICFTMLEDPNCLEGPPRTREELAGNFRELDKVAPTAAEKLMLMTGNLRPTPRTDALKAQYLKSSPIPWTALELAENLERELAEARELLEMHKEAKAAFPQRSDRRELEKQLAEAQAALRMLHDAANVYAADQSGVTDDRIGLVQPVTAEDGRRLNEALVVASTILNRSASTSPNTGDGAPPPPCPG